MARFVLPEKPEDLLETGEGDTLRVQSGVDVSGLGKKELDALVEGAPHARTAFALTRAADTGASKLHVSVPKPARLPPLAQRRSMPWQPASRRAFWSRMSLTRSSHWCRASSIYPRIR